MVTEPFYANLTSKQIINISHFIRTRIKFYPVSKMSSRDIAAVHTLRRRGLSRDVIANIYQHILLRLKFVFSPTGSAYPATSEERLFELDTAESREENYRQAVYKYHPEWEICEYNDAPLPYGSMIFRPIERFIPQSVSVDSSTFLGNGTILTIMRDDKLHITLLDPVTLNMIWPVEHDQDDARIILGENIFVIVTQDDLFVYNSHGDQIYWISDPNIEGAAMSLDDTHLGITDMNDIFWIINIRNGDYTELGYTGNDVIFADNWILIEGSTVKVIDKDSHELTHEMEFRRDIENISAGTNVIVVQDANKRIFMWFLDSNVVTEFSPTGETLNHCDVSRDGRRICAVNEHDILRVWTIDSPIRFTEIFTFEGVTIPVFSASGDQILDIERLITIQSPDPRFKRLDMS